MFKKGKHDKKSANKKRINILLSVLLVICLVFVGTVLGKYIVEKTLDDKLNLTITGAPQGNTLMVGATWDSVDDELSFDKVSGGFGYQIKKALADGAAAEATEIVFCGKDDLPAGLVTDWTTDGVNVDAADKGAVKAFYDSANTTIYIASYDNQMIATNANAGFMFDSMMSLETVKGLDFVDTSKTTNMRYMFSWCIALADMDVSSFDTSNVTDMTSTFEYCMSLSSLDVSGFDTSSVEKMCRLFAGCSVLKELDVSGWNTAKVTDMSFMFQGCKGLTELDVSGFDTANVTDDLTTDRVEGMNDMFSGCTGLTELKLVGWNTEKVTNMANMFKGCTGLTKVNLAGWNTAAVTNMSGMFSGCTALTTICANDRWSIGAVTSDTDMFKNCNVLVGGQGTSYADKKVNDADNCNNKTYAVIDRVQEGGAEGYLTLYEAYTLISGYDFNWMLWDGDNTGNNYDIPADTIEWEGFDGGDVRITKIVFGSYDEYKDTLGLTSWDDLAPGIALDAEQEGNIRLYIPGFDWSNTQGTSYDQTYYVLSKNNSIILANEDCSYMFRSDWGDTEFAPGRYIGSYLEEIVGLELIDTSNVTNMSTMFADCSIGEINVSNFDTSKVTDMSWMFAGCYLSTPLDVSNFDTSKVTNMSGMFQYYSLDTEVDLDLTHFDTSNVTNMSHMFDGASALKTIDVSKFDTSKVTNMGSMFSSLYYVTKLDLSNFDTANVTDMGYMFSYSSALTDLNILSFDTGKVTDMSFMFNECSALQELDISSFSTTGALNAADESVTYVNIAYMFYNCPNLEVIYASDKWDPTQVKVDYWSQVFYNDTVLVGGEGSTYAETASGDNYGDYVYARLDEKVSSGTMGLFTDKNAIPTGDFTLKKGENFNSVVADLISTTGATKIQFGSWAQYGEQNNFDWYGDTTAKILDVNDAGTIKAFVKGDTIYILSAGNMIANTKCYRMFDEMSTLTHIAGLADVDFSNTTDTSYMFYNCAALTTVDVTDVVTASNLAMDQMFSKCSSLEALDVSSFDTSNVEDMYRLFSYCTKLTKLDLTSFDTGKVTDFHFMFEECNGLTELTFDATKFKTSSATTMKGMFYYCDSLTALDLSGFSTGNVQDMSQMFEGCSGLTTLNVSGFDTDKVTDMFRMFDGCSSLTKLDVSGFDTTNVTNMEAIFSGCTGLTELNLSTWNTANVTNMDTMFRSCASLTELDLSTWNTANVQKMADMFRDCSNLVTILVSDGWSTVSVTDNGKYMFISCDKLTGSAGSTLATVQAAGVDKTTAATVTYAHIDGGTANPGYLTDINPIPTGDFTLMTGTNFNSVVSDLITDSGATKLQFGSWADYGVAYGFDWTDTSAVTLDVDNKGIKAFVKDGTIYILSGGNMFANADSSNMFKHSYGSDTGYIPQGALTAINGLASVDTSNVTNMSHMFEYCINLAALDVTSFNTEKVTDMSYMFRDCASLTTLDVSGLETNNVENMQEMFRYVNGLTTLDVSSFNTSKVTNMQGMFQDSGNLTTITGLNSTNFNTSIVTNMSWMFKGCAKLTSLDLSGFDTGAVTTMERMFGSYKGNTLDVSNFDTSNVTSMHYMFDACSNITKLDLSNWDTSAVTGNGMQGLFNLCENLAQIDGLTGFDTSTATTMREMFAHCAVTSLDLSSFDTSNVTDMVSMFYNCEELTTIYVDELWNTDKVTNSDFMFYQCYDLVGGAGTTWSSSYIRVERAHIDGGTSNPGYLTEILTYTLTTGSAFSTAIKNLFSTDVTNLQFGSFNQYGSANGLTWDSYIAFVDADNAGTIRLFQNGDTVYVLSQGMSRMAMNSDSAGMFRGGTSDNDMYSSGNYLTQIKGLETVDTSNATSGFEMFYRLKALTTVDVSQFNTSKIKTTERMFCYSGVTYLDVSNWDTSSFLYISYMFVRCENLTELDVSNWDLSNVSQARNAFLGCSSLKKLDFSKEGMSKLKVAERMFEDCSALTTLNISKWNLSSITAVHQMFLNCSSLTTLNLSNFDTSQVTDMSKMFSGCSSLASLDLSNFDTSKVTNMTNMFYGCTNLKTIYVTKSWSATAVTSSTNMFSGCTALKGGEGTTLATTGSVVDKTYARIDGIEGLRGYLTLKSENVPTGNFTLADGSAFRQTVSDLNENATKIQFGAWSKFGTANGFAWNDGVDVSDGNGGVKAFSKDSTVYILSGGQIFANANCESMFHGLPVAEIAGFETVDTSNATSMYCMFQFCEKLTSVNLTNLNTSNVTDMGYMFYGCSALETLDLSSFDTSNVEYMDVMFALCSSLTKIYVGDNWTTASNSGSMFRDCSSIQGGAGTTYSADHTDGEYARIDGGTSNPGYFTDVAQKTDASALSLDSAAAAEADGGEQDTAPTEPEADSTVEAMLPVAQTKEESESETEPDTDDPDAEEE